jgi:hypothetical protein
MDLNKLIPVLVHREVYAYGGENDPNPEANTLTSTFVSSGRFPLCKYTQFDGPGKDSRQVISVYPGNEVIFASLPDYLYKVKYTLKGRAKFWRYSSSINLAYQVYDTRGNLAEYKSGKGRANLFSFAFPLVVELSQGGTIVLEISAVKKLGKFDPLVQGLHCLEGVPIYNNVFDGKHFTRIMQPHFQEFSNRIREEYFSVSSGACERVQQQKQQILGVDVIDTIAGFDLKFGVLYFGRRCSDYFWFLLSIQEETLFQLSPSSYYFYCDVSGDYTLDHNFTIRFSTGVYHRCQGEIALIMVNSETSLIRYDCIATKVDNGYNFNSSNASSNRFSLEKGTSYYFAVTSFINTKEEKGELLSSMSDIVPETPGQFFKFTLG